MCTMQYHSIRYSTSSLSLRTDVQSTLEERWRRVGMFPHSTFPVGGRFLTSDPRHHFLHVCRLGSNAPTRAEMPLDEPNNTTWLARLPARLAARFGAGSSCATPDLIRRVSRRAMPAKHQIAQSLMVEAHKRAFVVCLTFSVVSKPLAVRQSDATTAWAVTGERC